MLYSSCSHSIRSLGIVYSAISSVAFNSCSGGTDFRPVFAYISSNTGDNSFSAASAICLILLSGCPFGTRLSGVIKLSIVACCFAGPRMHLRDHAAAQNGIGREAENFNSLLEDFGESPGDRTQDPRLKRPVLYHLS